ncbi:MAG: thioredoxin family protein [Myxococcales bacterium]
MSALRIVELTRQGCGPCSIQKAVIEVGFLPRHPDIRFDAVDVGSDEGSRLVASLQLTAVPAVVLLKGTTIAAWTTGLCDIEELEELLARAQAQPGDARS